MQSNGLFIRDIFNKIYQVAGPGIPYAPPVSASDEKHFADEQSASQFIRQFIDLAETFWLKVCGVDACPQDAHRPSRIPYDALAKMLVGGRIRFYQLPTIHTQAVRHNGKRKGYTFLCGPESLPVGLDCLKLDTPSEVQALLESLPTDELYWHKVLADAGLVSCQRESKRYSADAQRFLIDGSLRAYTFPYTPQMQRAKTEELESAPHKVVPLAPPPPADVSQLASKPIPADAPQSLEKVEALLAARREQIKTSGYQQKYTDEQLLAKAQQGEVDDRFFVRLIFVNPSNKVEDSSLGFKRDSGRAPYWATTLDMAEAADTDPEILAGLFGIQNFDPNQEFVLAVIDMDKMPPQAERQSFVPTYEKMQAFGEKEFSEKEGFDSQAMKKIMNDEFGVEYSNFAVDFRTSGENFYDSQAVAEHAELYTDSLNKQKLILARHRVEMEFGANPLFSGKGVTNVTPESRYSKDIGQQYGVVESFTFERDPLTISDLQKQGAVRLLPTKIIKG